MRVLFINTNDTSGGAARAAVRIMRGVQRCGVKAQMFVKYKNSQASDIVPLSQFVPSGILYRAFDWVATKIKNKWQHYKWRPYKQTKQNLYFSDLRSTCIHDALQKIDYDIIHLHWINNRFFDIRELAKIHKPIVWTLHDSWAFTGICHVPYECKEYETHCGACPMLGSKNEKDLACEVFEKKWEAYKDHFKVLGAWRQMFRCEFLRENQIWYIEDAMYEDTDCLLHAFIKAKRVQYVPLLAYYYRVNEESVSYDSVSPAKVAWRVNLTVRCRRNIDIVKTPIAKEVLGTMIYQSLTRHRPEVKELPLTKRLEYVKGLLPEISKCRKYVNWRTWLALRYGITMFI